MVYSIVVIFVLAGICVEESFGRPNAQNDDSRLDAPEAPENYYPKVPKVRVNGALSSFTCSGIFLNSSTVVTDDHCVAGYPLSNITVKVRQSLDHTRAEVYQVTFSSSLSCSKSTDGGCGVALLLLNKPAEGASVVNVSEKTATLPQKDEPLTLISWDISRSSDKNGAKKNSLRSLDLKVEISGPECAEKFEPALQHKDLICAKVTSPTELPRDILGGSLVDRNGIFVGIVSSTKSLDNGEVLVVSTALATQRAFIDSSRNKSGDDKSFIDLYLSMTTTSRPHSPRRASNKTRLRTKSGSE